MKVTNNLLAAVLILTVVPSYVGFSEAALEYCCSTITQKLQDKNVRLSFSHSYLPSDERLFRYR